MTDLARPVLTDLTTNQQHPREAHMAIKQPPANGRWRDGRL